MPLHPEEDFTPRHVISVSSAALAYAREFAESIGSVRGGSRIVSFDWATSIIIKGPEQPERDLGAGLMLGAYRRDEVPVEARRYTDGLEFAVRIPTSIWSARAGKVIDRDDTLYFKLVLR